MKILNLIGRSSELFSQYISLMEKELSKIVKDSSFLVIGGADSIGRAVTKEILKRNLVKFYVVDISQNNGSELEKYRMSSFEVQLKPPYILK